MSRHLFRHLFIASLIALFTSCGSSRKGAPSTGEYPPGGEAAQQGITWTDLRVPVSVSIARPTSLRVSGVMTMVRDKDVHISLRMLGFEVGAAYITSDSVYAYAKLQRVYVAESISRLLGGIDATVGDVQALLIGAPVDLPALRRSAMVDIVSSQTTGQPLSISVAHPSGRTASVTYTPMEGMPLASDMTISATSGQKQLQATIAYNWSRAEADTGSTRAFAIPKGYRRIDAAALLRSLAGK